jgi:parallel beta-helix repeat protein
MTIAAASAAVVSLTLAASTLTTAPATPAPSGLSETGDRLPDLPVSASLRTEAGRHLITLTVPPGLDTATLGLDAGRMTDATGWVTVSPTNLLPDDIVHAGAPEITRAGLPANAPSMFEFQLTPTPGALGQFALWTTAPSEALTTLDQTRRLRFPSQVTVTARTRLDLDNNGTIDEQDLVAATALMSAGDPRADLDGDGVTGPGDLITLADHMGRPVIEMNQGSAPAGNRLDERDPSDAGFGADTEPPRPYATTMVNGGGVALQNAILAAADGDTLLVGPGTYTPGYSPLTLQITKRLTIVSTGGAGSTFIAAPSGTTGSVAVHMRVSGTTLKGFTITGGGFGVLSSDPGGVGTLTDQILSDLIITTDAGNPGHGVLFERTTDSRIDDVSIIRAQANGIMLDQNSHRNVVNHCAVLATETQHAYAVKNSDSNVITHCSSTSAFADSMIVLGGYGNCIKDNTFSGHLVDGIVLTDDDPTVGGTGRTSRHNCVLRNVITSTGFAQGRSHGTGIWMNSEANSNLVKGNSVSGHAENGIAIFNSDDNIVEFNSVFSNGQGGVIVWDAQSSGFVASRGGRPTNNLIRANDFSSYLSNGAVNIRDADNTEIRDNFMRNTANGTGNAGVIIDEPSPPSFTPTAPSTGTIIVGNTLEDLPITLLSRQASTGTKYYQNKHFNTGVTQIFPPADVTFDGGVTLGGNHWAGFAASGNPSRITPYTDIVVDLVGNRGGPYSDRYPYQSESLSKPYTPNIVFPLFSATTGGGPGHVFVEGSRLLIQWKPEAGRYANIVLGRVGLGSSGNIAFRVPNTGFYLWTIPTLARANDYTLTVDIMDSDFAIKGSETTEPFAIAPPGLTLLSPCDTDAVAQGGTIRIHYNDETNAGAGSNIFYMVRDALSPVDDFNVVAATNNDRNKEYVDFDLANLPAFSTGAIFPNTVGGFPNPVGNDPRNPTNYFQVGISTGSGNAGTPTDFSDGLMRIQATLTADTTALADTFTNNNEFLIDACQSLVWFSPVGSEIVDIEIYEGTGYRTIRSGMKDVGFFLFDTPELATNGAKFRVTFKTGAGVTISTVETTPVDVVYDTTPGVAKPYFRFYNLLTQEHLYTTLIPERDALNAAVGVWLQEPDQGSIYDGPATLNGVKGVPYYRLLNTVTMRHLWTTDRNEYFTLRETYKDSWIAEGVDGYLLPTQTGNAIPLYRLRFATGLPLQHWTTDLNEYNTLPSRGWVQEGIVGYLLP